MRAFWAVLPMVVLGACSPVPGNPDAGVGFSDYETYLQQREAALRGNRPAPAPILPPAVAATPAPQRAPVAAVPTRMTPGQPMSALAPGVLPGATTQISDENSFEAVSGRRSIAADAERIAANREMYQPVTVTALPARPGDSAPNLVAYALSAQNRLGQPVWKRGGLSLARHDKACAKYTSADLAQMAFLKRGGPERDPGNLDPDGDGFACAWDPTPFQAVRN